MIEHVKLAAKIGGRSLLKWILLVAAGCFLTFISIAVVLFDNAELGGGGHGVVVAFTLNLFFQNTIGFLLLAGSPVFIFLYFMVANKIAIATTIHQLLKHKAGDMISSQVGRLVEGLTQSGTWVAKGSDAALLRAKLLQANMDDPNTSKLKRKVIQYVSKKIQLDDIDLQDGNTKLSTIVVGKVEHFMHETAKPSLKLFWLLVLVQLGLLLWSVL